ncbi:Sporulation and spore germination [Raineyella antarctica]|uniref:Sporulation and spore germination n=2 Tax=Raineyella antarctica TaxID=1577474 RepID=A0A1G6GEI8_9ACTN|nr:Sporulation and spore germination [Raineyella antarctica]
MVRAKGFAGVRAAGAVLAGLLLLAGCTPPDGNGPQPTNGPGAGPERSQSSTATKTVLVYFDNQVLNPNAADCSKVYAVPRTVPASADMLTASMQQLLAGPTAAESAQGYRSWFSSATANALVSAKVSGGTSYVNLTDIRTVIPNASTSCGSQALLAQLGTTAQQAGMTPQVRYAIEGQPKAFWEWLQMGCDASNDNCDAAPFN